jgi:hypothetical protein
MQLRWSTARVNVLGATVSVHYFGFSGRNKDFFWDD